MEEVNNVFPHVVYGNEFYLNNEELYENSEELKNQN